MVIRNKDGIGIWIIKHEIDFVVKVLRGGVYGGLESAIYEFENNIPMINDFEIRNVVSQYMEFSDFWTSMILSKAPSYLTERLEREKTEKQKAEKEKIETIREQTIIKEKHRIIQEDKYIYGYVTKGRTEIRQKAKLEIDIVFGKEQFKLRSLKTGRYVRQPEKLKQKWKEQK